MKETESLPVLADGVPKAQPSTNKAIAMTSSAVTFLHGTAHPKQPKKLPKPKKTTRYHINIHMQANRPLLSVIEGSRSLSPSAPLSRALPPPPCTTSSSPRGSRGSAATAARTAGSPPLPNCTPPRPKGTCTYRVVWWGLRGVVGRKPMCVHVYRWTNVSTPFTWYVHSNNHGLSRERQQLTQKPP